MIKKITRIYLAVYIMTMGIIPVRQACSQVPNTKSLAVLNLEAKGVSIVESDVISDQIRSHISRIVISDEYNTVADIERYSIIERTQMDKIFDQYEIQNTGCVADSCMIEYGKMLSANRILVGTLGHLGRTYTISVRIIDVETSQTMATADRQHRGSIDALQDRVIADLVNELMFGVQKKLKLKWYLLAGAVVAAGAGAAMMGGGSDGGGTTARQPLPLPPDMP